jgi:hypothetical protein
VPRRPCAIGGRALLQGTEFADSLSLDPHQWLFQSGFFQSIECGCVRLRDAGIVKSTYRIMPEYRAEVQQNVAGTKSVAIHKRASC